MAVFDGGRAEDEDDDELVADADNHAAVDAGANARAMPENVPDVPNNPPPPRVEEARMATTAVASSPSVDESREDSFLPQKRTPDAIKRATIGNVAGKYDDPIEEDDSSDEDLDVTKAPSPPPAKKAKTSVPPSNGETAGLKRADNHVATAPAPPTAKKSAPPSKARANGKKKIESSKPTFSASDLFQVSYDKKKKKKKKSKSK